MFDTLTGTYLIVTPSDVLKGTCRIAGHHPDSVFQLSSNILSSSTSLSTYILIHVAHIVLTCFAFGILLRRTACSIPFKNCVSTLMSLCLDHVYIAHCCGVVGCSVLNQQVCNGREPLQTCSRRHFTPEFTQAEGNMHKRKCWCQQALKHLKYFHLILHINIMKFVLSTSIYNSR